MSNDEKKPLLSEEEMARIRAEEEFRAQARAEAEAKTKPLSKKEQRALEAKQAQERQAENVEKAKQMGLDPTVERPKEFATISEQMAFEDARATLLPPDEYAKYQRNKNIQAAIILAILLIGGIFIFRSCFVTSPQERSQAQQREANARLLSTQSPSAIAYLCEASVKEKLKAPTTAQFNDSSRPTYSGGNWTWTSHVDAQNSFGAMVRTPFLCEITGSTLDDGRISTVLLD